MSKKRFTTAIFVFLFSAMFVLLQSCYPQHPAFKDREYRNFFGQMLKKIEKKEDYRKLPIKTKVQFSEMLGLSYGLFKKKITQGQFKKNLNQKYPGYSKSVNWLAEEHRTYKQHTK